MTKTNSFKVTNKLPIWLAIPAVIILAGLVLFFFLGFNPSASVTDNKTVVISHDSYVQTSESLKEDLIDVCESEIEKAGLNFIDYSVSENEDGGQIEYIFSQDVSGDKLYALKESILNAVNADSALNVGFYKGTVHDNVAQHASTYIWRAAISAGVALVLAFIYVAVRYRLSMGLATIVSGLIDVAVMLALTVVLRIPVTSALATAAIFAALYSILVSTVSFNKIRELVKSEEYEALSTEEAMEQANAQASKRVLVLSVAVLVFSAILAIFGGAAVRAFALPVIFSVVASTFSGMFLTPSLATAFKVQGVKMQANGKEKARLAKKKEEEEKAQKRNTKKD
ncbi:MAG: hypothetical protein IJY26_04495 [Clostridia bacterium]|nr:hypothetical protein [Clostridia bacterium]